MQTADPYLDEVLTDTRVLAVLSMLEQVPGKRQCRCGATAMGSGLTHWDGCWQAHTGCLATRIRTTLTGEDLSNA